MRYFIILIFVNFAFCQSDMFKPSDFIDNPPKFPIVILPTLSDDNVFDSNSSDEENSLIKGYRVQITISQNEKELQEIQKEIEKVLNEKSYIIFELPNYKLRVGNFLNRKEAENFQKKIVRLGYRKAWVVPTIIEMEN